MQNDGEFDGELGDCDEPEFDELEQSLARSQRRKGFVAISALLVLLALATTLHQLALGLLMMILGLAIIVAGFAAPRTERKHHLIGALALGGSLFCFGVPVTAFGLFELIFSP